MTEHDIPSHHQHQTKKKNFTNYLGTGIPVPLFRPTIGIPDFKGTGNAETAPLCRLGIPVGAGMELILVPGVTLCASE